MESETPKGRRPLWILVVLAVVLLTFAGLVAFRLRPNTAPSGAAVQATATTVPMGDELNLTLAFTDPNGDDYLVTWALGDGKSAEGQAISASWDAPGRYWVVGTVDDRRGGVSISPPFAVTVSPISPADPSNVSETTEAAYAEFSASAFDTSPGALNQFDGSFSGEWNWTRVNDTSGVWTLNRNRPGLVADWSWSFGDGETASGGPLMSHTFADPGLYFVRLTVTHKTDNGWKLTNASWGVTIRVV